MKLNTYNHASSQKTNRQRLFLSTCRDPEAHPSLPQYEKVKPNNYVVCNADLSITRKGGNTIKHFPANTTDEQVYYIHQWYKICVDVEKHRCKVYYYRDRERLSIIIMTHENSRISDSLYKKLPIDFFLCRHIFFWQKQLGTSPFCKLQIK